MVCGLSDHEYKRLCHELKQADADDMLSSPQIECRAPTPKPNAQLVKESVQLPMPSSFGASRAIRSVHIKSVALVPHRGDANSTPRPSTAKRAASRTSTPNSARGNKSKNARTEHDHDTNWKLELCSQCFMRHETKEVVYLEQPNGESQSFHGGRQKAGKAHTCINFVSQLTTGERATWKVKLRAMSRSGELRAMYDQLINCEE